MPRKVILVLLIIFVNILSSVHGEKILFKKGYIKYMKHGKRQVFHNVTAIDEKIIDISKDFVFVKTKTMPVLHSRSVGNLPNLRDIYMAECGIRFLASQPFFNLPNLTSIHLEDNEIREIKNNVFNGLSVRILSLQKNRIKNIESSAFDNMPNLYKIKLNSNRLKAWDLNWFKNCPKLTELYFRRNKINHVPPFAFSNIKTSHLVNGEWTIDTKIFLSKNKIGVITPSSFYNLTVLSQLYLDRNNFSEIPEDAFRDLVKVDVIYLARNKIIKISENAFPKVKKIGILDLSSNLLTCLPYRLVSVANLTNLEKNGDGSCDCAANYKAQLMQAKKNNEITCQNKLL